MTDRKSDQIYKIDPADGAVRDSIPAPAYAVRGLTWDGRCLWCVDATEEKLYAVNPQTRLTEKIISSPVSRPNDLAWDGTALWLADDGADMLQRISPDDGTILTTIPAPSANPGGLTWDGRYLWVADRIENRLYLVAPDRGDVIFIIDAPGPHSWGLAWDGQYLWNVDYQTDRIYQIVAEDTALFSRTDEKYEQVEYFLQARCFGPDTVKTLDIFLAVPENRNNQDLVGEVVFEPKPDEIVADRWGQKIAYFRSRDVAAPHLIEVKMTARAKLYENRYFVRPEKVGKLGEIPKEIKTAYLADDAKFDIKNPIIQKAVKEALGDETNPYWMARKMFTYVGDHLEYDLAGGWEVAPKVLERGTGSCSEYTFVYIAMCRAAGIPARYVGSIVVRGDDASWDEYFHRWVEIYLPGVGWIPVDPQGGDQKRPGQRAESFGGLSNRFLITTAGGGGSEYLEWDYNANLKMTTVGRCKVDFEAFGEWTPLQEEKKE